MANEEKLTYEITMARNDLEQNLADLKQAVVDELDFGKQAHKVIDKVKEKAGDVYDEQAFKARVWFNEARHKVELKLGEAKTYAAENPRVVAAVGAGVVVAIAGGVLLYRKLAD